MRDSSRSFSNRIFIILGTISTLVLVVVLITGGFVIRAGPVFFSVHRWTDVAVVTALVWSPIAWRRRADLASRATRLYGLIDRHATAIALVMVAAAVGAGIRFGTYAASGSDAAGYVSQADLLAHGALTRDEPLARIVGWRDASLSFETLGYKTGRDAGTFVPTYPPGLPLTMAGAQRLWGEFGPFLVSPLLGGVAVLAIYLFGARVHSKPAGLVAAALLATSPIFLFQVSQPMSDVPAAAWWTLSLMLAVAPRRSAALASGFSAGFAVLTRPNLAPLVLPIAAIHLFWPTERPAARSSTEHVEPARGAASPWRQRIVRLSLFAAAIAPFVLGLIGVQWFLYGRLAASGHGTFSEFFSLANVGPNIGAYTDRIIVGELPALCLVAAASLMLLLLRRRSRSERQRSLTGTILMASGIVAVVLACYLPYGVFAEWSYLRFLLPGLPAFFAATAVLVVEAIDRLPSVAQGAVLLAVLAVASLSNVAAAVDQQAFAVRRSEERYQIAGRYLEAMLPATAVIVTSQHSASDYHYTHRPILRWDLLRVDLDAAVDRLQQLGRHPVFVLEDWENADLLRRFPASRLARLDWTPQAEIADFVRVRVYDPSDRGMRARLPDRLHQWSR